ncbi:mechanosensitive ion channel family protein [Desulfonatronovibrio magnus]|uniref:mechanosensitive ion channel family protein n=1 Tax=Desulfonatronovibrio magnus TaxID=698827 RepID=UPI0006982D8D|nr:mechanosensitive ion channel domain-containing protein [Desulfonatronovibrio magnus]
MRQFVTWSQQLTISLIVMFFMGLIYFSPAAAQESGTSQAGQVNMVSIEKLLKDLEDPQRLEAFKQDLRALLQAQQALSQEPDFEPRGLVGQLMSLATDYVQDVNKIISDAGSNVLEIPTVVQDIVEQAQDQDVLKSWAEMLGKVILVLLAGLLAQIVVSRLLSKPRKALEDKEAYSKLYRLLLMAGNTLLEVVPIAAFAGAAYGLLPLLDPEPVTQLVALTLINANVLVRLILAFVRLMLVPNAPGLRFLPIDNESVQYLYIWSRRVSRIGVYGYFILEATLIMGLSEGLYLFLLKVLGLAVTLMFIILILQNRAEVAKWLRGSQPEIGQDQTPESDDKLSLLKKAKAVGALRKRLADFWHVGVILLIVAMYVVWALEIEGGLFFVAKAVVLTFMVIALTHLVIKLTKRGLENLFKISEELKLEHPQLEARANKYLPLLKYSIKTIIYLVAVFSVLQIWGMGTMSWVMSPQGGAILSSLLVIFLIGGGAFLFWEVFSFKVEEYLTKEKEGDQTGKVNTRALTLLPLLSNVVRIALILVAGMSILSHLGINIAPLLAGAGVIGLAVGFGAQTLVRDVITGAFILMEDSIAVGDWVEAGGYAGTVEHLTIRTLTLRDLTGAVAVIPFGDVTAVKNNNRDYGYALVDAGVAYREDYGQVVQALQDVALELQEDEVWGPDIIGELEVFGLNNLADSAVEVRVRIKTRPMRQFSVRRAFLERMKRIFDERGIEIPFPHQTIWFGVDKDGSAPPMRLVKDEQVHDSETKAIETTYSQPEHEPEIKYASESEASADVVRELEESEEEKKKIEGHEEDHDQEVSKEKRGDV